MVIRIGILETGQSNHKNYPFLSLFFYFSSYSSELRFSINGATRPEKNSLQDLRKEARGLYQRAEKLEQKITTSSHNDIRYKYSQTF